MQTFIQTSLVLFDRDSALFVSSVNYLPIGKCLPSPFYCINKYKVLQVTAGGQGEGKEKINEFKPSKGYRDGLKQGEKNLARKLSSIAEKHLKIELRADKANNKVSQKQYEKFMDLLKVGEDNQ